MPTPKRRKLSKVDAMKTALKEAIWRPSSLITVECTCVHGNEDEWVTLTAGGNDDEGSALGNDDDAMRAIHSNDRAVPYISIHY